MIILRQREYARADYAGLDAKQAEILKSKRKDYAKSLLKAYRETKKGASDYLDLNNSQNVESRFKGIRGGGVVTDKTISTDLSGLSRKEAKDLHLKRIANEFGNNTEAKKIMRDSVINDPNTKLTLKDIAQKKELEEKAVKGFKESVKGAKKIKNAKIAAGVVGGSALVGAGVYGYKKYKDSKK